MASPGTPLKFSPGQKNTVPAISKKYPPVPKEEHFNTIDSAFVIMYERKHNRKRCCTTAVRER